MQEPPSVNEREAAAAAGSRKKSSSSSSSSSKKFEYDYEYEPLEVSVPQRATSSASTPLYDSTTHYSEAHGDDAYLSDDAWVGNMDGFDWEIEKVRRLLEGPSFAPLRMTLWQPVLQRADGQKAPGFWDAARILLNNGLQMFGLAESLDGAPMVQGVMQFDGSPLQFLARVIDGNLQELAGGPLFLLLAKYYETYGPVYKLAFGPKSFMVVSDPVMARHILKENPTNYDKGILAEILEPVMGKGLIPADPATWKVRRKAIVPGFHKAWLNAMMALFVDCNKALVRKLDSVADTSDTINMETEFCSVSLDIIGRAVFNYDFGSVNSESPVVKAVYRALQEAEHRSTSFIPYWNLPFAKYYMKNLQDFEENMELLNTVLDKLIQQAFETQQEADIEELETRDYSKMENPSLLRFLVDMRGEEVRYTLNTTHRTGPVWGLDDHNAPPVSDLPMSLPTPPHFHAVSPPRRVGVRPKRRRRSSCATP